MTKESIIPSIMAIEPNEEIIAIHNSPLLLECDYRDKYAVEIITSLGEKEFDGHHLTGEDIKYILRSAEWIMELLFAQKKAHDYLKDETAEQREPQEAESHE